MSNFWQFIQQKLIADINIILLYVVESKGSSPGRHGFKMAVAKDDTFYGTIGGGIMEFKLVEKAKQLLKNESTSNFLQEQFHDKQHTKNQSGMICSGSQTIAFIHLAKNDCNIIAEIVSNTTNTILLSQKGISISYIQPIGFQYFSEQEWQFTGAINTQPVIHIIGGGHCCLALSELMSYLNFYVHVYDDRENLNTVEANHFANEKHLVNYETIGTNISIADTDIVVIMTVGYRTDKTVLKQLMYYQCRYLGLLGSEQKISTLFDELQAEGVSTTTLQQIFAPIGLPINSKTTREIAISIAAEIVKKMNE